jgi:hypothetical protein
MPTPGDPSDGTARPPDVSPLAYLVGELDLDPPRPVHRRRRGRLGAVAVSVVALLAVVITASRLAGSDATTETGSTEEAADGAVSTTGDSGDSGDSGVEAYRGPDWVRAENARTGTGEWVVPDDPVMWEKVRGFADATSVDHGEAFTLYVTTEAPTFTVDAYRIGHYGGAGARLIWSSGPRAGTVQPGPEVDPTTNMAEAPWTPSLEVATGPEWPPGMYLLKLTSSDGGASFVPMVVRDDGSRAGLLVQSSVTTWQAYNGWGGANLYTGRGGASETRARVVSFDRPYGGNGSGEFFGREFEFVLFVERLGLDVTYWTDIDLHERPELLAQRNAFVSLGHDEYYSNEMRAGLEAARDDGVNLAFFGANAIYRKIRLEDSPLGTSRREVNYRSAAEDPLTGVRDDEVTVSWREAPSNDPESALIGNYYECNPVEADWVVADASAWMFEGTGFRDGDIVPDMVGNEYDRVTPEAPTPESIQVIAHSPVTCRGMESYADSTYYTVPSGAGVFAVGTFWLIPRLIVECPAPERRGADDAPERRGADDAPERRGADDAPGPTTPDCRVQRMTENILRAFAEGPVGERHPSRNNLAELGIVPGYTAGPRADDHEEPTSTTRRSTTSTSRSTGSTGGPTTTARSSTTATTATPTTTAAPTTSPTTSSPVTDG